MVRPRLRHLAPWLVLLALTPAQAKVTVGVDAETLNELLPPLAPRTIEVPLAQGTVITVELQDLRVTGFDPASGPEGRGHVLTAVRVRVPELGLEMPLTPRLSLRPVDVAGRKLLQLTFEKASLPLPLAGSVNIARFMPPLQFPAESVFYLQGVDSEVEVTSRLVDVMMGVKVLRFDFDLKAGPVPR